MFHLLHRFIVAYAARQNRRALAEGRPICIIPPKKDCSCHVGEPPSPDQFDIAVMPVGEWEGPVPHPHPAFADRVKVMRVPILYVRRCKFCAGLTNTAGYSYRDAPKT